MSSIFKFMFMSSIFKIYVHMSSIFKIYVHVYARNVLVLRPFSLPFKQNLQIYYMYLDSHGHSIEFSQFFQVKWL